MLKLYSCAYTHTFIYKILLKRILKIGAYSYIDGIVRISALFTFDGHLPISILLTWT